MQTESFAACDIGLKRETNEDRYVIDEGLNLFAVSDGMGGHAAGEVAATRSLEVAAEHLRSNSVVLKSAGSSPDGYFRVLQLAEDAVEEASRQLYTEASENSELAGMGATLTMLIVIDDKGIMAHIGDSRLYLLRQDKIHLLSNDHTLANELLQAGQLTPAEASQYSNVLTRSIGVQSAVQVESLLFDLLPGDVCLICSDGLSNYFRDDAEVSQWLANEQLDVVPQKLVDIAKSRGGSDNITALVARVLDTGSKTPNPADLKERLEALRSVPLFHGLSLSRLTRVMNVASVRNLSAGTTVVTEGNECSGIFIVLGGRLSVTGGSSFASQLTNGHWFGAETLVHKQKSRATIVADENSRVMYISGEEFDRLTHRQPRLGRQLLWRLSQHLSEQVLQLSAGPFDPADTADCPPPA